MACNFKIYTHRNSDGVHFKLIGDFDGSSAHVLLNNIKIYSRIANQIFIHTNGLTEVHPFGKAVFQNNFNDVNKQDVFFIFTGEYGNSLAPWKKESVIIN